jgi:hypothetical protein
MQYWVSLSEIIRNIGVLVGGALGIYLAWKRVTASNLQAEAQKDEKLEIRLGAIHSDPRADLYGFSGLVGSCHSTAEYLS